jgi:small neutral amino acid transporter SnatA (MarC family)
VLKNVFQVRLGSLQVFGGLINLFIAYRYITVGPGSNLLFRGNISDLAPTISWLSILIGRAYFTHLNAQSETLLGKYFSILMRTMALFIGAIGVEMIFSGIEQALINRPTGEGTESLFQRLSGG